MAQTSILGRIGQLVRANVNAILDQAEDPEKMLDQLIRDFTNNIAEAEEAVAQTIGNLRLMEDDAREAREAAGEWMSKAKAASTAPTQLRAEGNTAEADRFDGLAKLALRRELGVRGAVTTLRHADRRSRPSSRTSSRTASTSCASSARSWSRSATSSSAARRWPRRRCRSSSRSRTSRSSIPTSRAQPLRGADPPPGGAGARAWRRSASSSLEDQFAELESGEDEIEVEARLAELKGKALRAGAPALGVGRG